jgi:MinD superfamily P-loop ATPase
VIWRGPVKFSVIRQFLSDVEWGALDYLIVDCPPGTGDEPLSVAQMGGRAAMGVIVTTPQALAVSDVRRCVTFCRQVGLEIAGIVENMSGLECPSCQAAFDLFGSGGGERLAEEMGIPFLGAIPIDPGVVSGGDAGRPFAAGSDDGPVPRAFAGIVARIESARPAAHQCCGRHKHEHGADHEGCGQGHGECGHGKGERGHEHEASHQCCREKAAGA